MAFGLEKKKNKRKPGLKEDNVMRHLKSKIGKVEMLIWCKTIRNHKKYLV